LSGLQLTTKLVMDNNYRSFNIINIFNVYIALMQWIKISNLPI